MNWEWRVEAPAPIQGFFYSWNMNFLEKDLEEIIYEADRCLLNEKGLPVSGKMKRQLRIGNYGIADLVTFDRDYDEDSFIKEKISPKLNICVYELKKDNVGISAFLQAIGYVKGLQRYFETRNFKYDIIYSINLIGSKIDKKSTFIYLPSLIPSNEDGSAFLNVFRYSYGINGLEFEHEYGYLLADEGL